MVRDEELNPNFIIPTVFNAEVPKAVAAAIRGARQGLTGATSLKAALAGTPRTNGGGRCPTIVRHAWAAASGVGEKTETT